jgi:hypothetical protein
MNEETETHTENETVSARLLLNYLMAFPLDSGEGNSVLCLSQLSLVISASEW